PVPSAAGWPGSRFPGEEGVPWSNVFSQSGSMPTSGESRSISGGMVYLPFLGMAKRGIKQRPEDAPQPSMPLHRFRYLPSITRVERHYQTPDWPPDELRREPFANQYGARIEPPVVDRSRNPAVGGESRAHGARALRQRRRERIPEAGHLRSTRGVPHRA